MGKEYSVNIFHFLIHEKMSVRGKTFTRFIRDSMNEHRKGTPDASDLDLFKISKEEWMSRKKLVIDDEEFAPSQVDYIRSRKEEILRENPGIQDFPAYLMAMEDWKNLPTGSIYENYGYGEDTVDPVPEREREVRMRDLSDVLEDETRTEIQLSSGYEQFMRPLLVRLQLDFPRNSFEDLAKQAHRAWMENNPRSNIDFNLPMIREFTPMDCLSNPVVFTFMTFVIPALIWKNPRINHIEIYNIALKMWEEITNQPLPLLNINRLSTFNNKNVIISIRDALFHIHQMNPGSNVIDVSRETVRQLCISWEMSNVGNIPYDLVSTLFLPEFASYVNMRKSLLMKEKLGIDRIDAETEAISEYRNLCTSFGLGVNVKDNGDFVECDVDFYPEVQPRIRRMVEERKLNFKDIVDTAVKYWQKANHYIEEIRYINYDWFKYLIGPNYDTFIGTSYRISEFEEAKSSTSLFLLQKWYDLCKYPPSKYMPTTERMAYKMIRDVVEDMQDINFIIDNLYEAKAEGKTDPVEMAEFAIFHWQENNTPNHDLDGIDITPIVKEAEKISEEID